MVKKQVKQVNSAVPTATVFMTAQQLAKVTGVGENYIREQAIAGEIEYLQVGNRKLFTIDAMLDFYERHKTPVSAPGAVTR